MVNEVPPRSTSGREESFTVGAPETAVVLEPQSHAVTALACVGGLLVPGLGHIILKRWVRGALLFVSILLMFVLGLGMEGPLHPQPDSGGLVSFDTLKTFANAGTGLAYILAMQAGQGKGIPTSQTYDYGWAFLLVAGLLNYICVLDAFDIAKGRKP